MHLTPRVARLFCLRTFLWITWLTQIPLWFFFVGGESHRGWLCCEVAHTDPTDLNDFFCGWGISQRVEEHLIVWVVRLLWVLRVLWVLHLLLLPKVKWLFVWFVRFVVVCGEKIGCTGWCTLWFWSDRRDSNPRPSAWEANALPTEPLSHNVDIFIAPYGGLLLLNSQHRPRFRVCRSLSRCRLLPMRQCCRGWVRDKRSRGVPFARLQRRCCS